MKPKYLLILLLLCGCGAKKAEKLDNVFIGFQKNVNRNGETVGEETLGRGHNAYYGNYKNGDTLIVHYFDPINKTFYYLMKDSGWYAISSTGQPIQK